MMNGERFILVAIFAVSAIAGVSCRTGVRDDVAQKAPTGKTWQVEEIGGSALANPASTELRIAEDGQVSGTAGCNRFTGKATIDGANLAFSPLATTRRACEPALMEQERTVLDALHGVKRFSWGEDGKLVLLGADGGALLRLSPATSGTPSEAPAGKFAPGQEVAMRGTLGTGAECPTLTLDQGRMFSLAGDLGRWKPGDQVCVRGTIAEMSFCMAGEGTIAVTSVAAADSCP